MHCLIRRGKTDKVQPVLYVAKGSHAIYPKEGAIDHTFPNANSEIPFLLVDYCNKGPRYDPLHSSYMYMYSPPESPSPKTVQGAEVPGSLQPLAPTTLPPGWLYFTGHWGDQTYPDDDPRQKNKDFLGFRRYGDGPTGPAFKGLEREEVWPANSYASGQRIKSSLDGSTWWKDWWARCKAKSVRETRVKRVDVAGRVVDAST